MLSRRTARGCDHRRWGLALAACFVSLGLLQKHTSLLVAPLFVLAYVALLTTTERALRSRPSGSVRFAAASRAALHGCFWS